VSDTLRGDHGRTVGRRPTAVGEPSIARPLSVIAYHYVRDLDRSRYPRIKARRTDEFVRQVRMLRERFTPITMEQLREALRDPAARLPLDAVLLTFDDGYADHADTAAPVLADLGLQGAFFVPAQPILERRVMPVNKIHFVLAALESEATLLELVFAGIDRGRGEFSLPSNEELYERYSEPNRYDTAAVTFTKRMLQSVLPFELRTAIVDDLFATLVTADETAFADELYMSAEQVVGLRSAGMHVGAHGHSHLWMDTLPPATQVQEIESSREFLGMLGCDAGDWTMCYPYGRWSPSLAALLRERGCWAAFTMSPRVADLDADGALCLPRLDTNDFAT
jgi:peptidoglycan/xylan/chitin deacetylase (PgdA/CDA1 family)